MVGTPLLYGCKDGMNTMALAIGIPLMNIVIVALRFYTRRKQDSRFAADDWWALGALIILIGMGIDLLIAAVNQFLSCPSPQNEVAILGALGTAVPHVAWAFYLLGVLGVGCVKITFLYCMRRIFCTGETGTGFSRITYTVMSVVVMWTLGFIGAIVIVNINWGEPDAGNPSKWAARPATYATTTMFFALTVSDVVIDFVIMILPAFVILTLSLSAGRKAAIGGIFSLRLLALAASATRMSYTVMFAKWMDDLLSIDPMLTDPTHLLVGQNLNTQMIWWTMLEVGFGLFASCITTIQFLLRRHHVDSFVNKVRSLFGLPPRPTPDRFESQSPRSMSMRPSHERGGSKHGTLYMGDQNALSDEYMIGSIASSPTDAGKHSMDSSGIEPRHGYTRKDSSASLSMAADEVSEV